MRRNVFPVSPPHLIDTIIMFCILVCGLGVIIFYHIFSPFPYYWTLYIAWGGIFLIIFLTFCLSYRGVFVVRFYRNNYIESVFVKKTILRLSYEDIQYVSFVKSRNYGADIGAYYIVLSKEPIEGKHLALTFHTKKQIVIRVTTKNYTTIKELLSPLSISFFPLDFEKFQTRIEQYDLRLEKQKLGAWHVC